MEVSARHLHLNRRHLNILFGNNSQLTIAKRISQPGQFAAAETVRVIGPRGELSKVRVVGPLREETQLELAMTDAVRLGIVPKLRTSGNLKGTTGNVTLVGPKGSVRLRNGVILARRHLHIEPALASQKGLRHLQKVIVETAGPRKVVFHNVVVRSRAGIDKLAFQIDTDEGNAADIRGRQRAQIIIKGVKK